MADRQDSGSGMRLILLGVLFGVLSLAAVAGIVMTFELSIYRGPPEPKDFLPYAALIFGVAGVVACSLGLRALHARRPLPVALAVLGIVVSALPLLLWLWLIIAALRA